MDETTRAPTEQQPRNLWLRALFMLVMAVAFYLAAWALLITAVVQLLQVVVNGAANERLRSFGRAVGRYLVQIANFVTFNTEEVPFPFSDWPKAS